MEKNDYLENWTTLNSHIQGLDEETVRKLLKHEMKTSKRPQFLTRLFGRYNTLRNARERVEVFNGTWVG